jgi:hypothetical protein
MVVSDLSDDHVTFGIPRAGGAKNTKTGGDNEDEYLHVIRFNSTTMRLCRRQL